MIPDWPDLSPYAEATKRLNDTITIAKLRDAINELAESMRKAAQVNSDLADKIRDDLAVVTDMLAGLDKSGQP